VGDGLNIKEIRGLRQSPGGTEFNSAQQAAEQR
jgi:hypothetical protein